MQVQESVINGFRLSPQQKRVWLLQQDSLAYRVQCAILIEGSLQPNYLKLALEKVVLRQEILRTSFQRPPGIKTPVQVINDKYSLFWQKIDLADVESQEQLSKVEFLFQQEKIADLNYEQDALLRSSLIKLSANQHLLLLTMPALCADSYSIKILLKEISDCYQACLIGVELSDEEVVQYLQFSEWQNELLEDPDAEAGKKFWEKYDLAELAALSIPLEKTTSINYSRFEINSYKFKIESSLLAKSETIAQNYNSSISNLLLTCWQILLWRLTEKSNIAIGINADGRKYEELESIIGLLSKYLPLQAKLEDNFTFKEVLQAVESVEDVNEWQEYFNWDTLAESQTDNFFPFSFDFQEQNTKYSVGDLTFSIHQQFVCNDRFKVKLNCIQQADNLVITFDYDCNLFSAIDIEQLAGYFQALLESAVDQPETAISELAILSESDRHQLLVQFNNLPETLPTTSLQAQNKCFHQLFTEQVTRTPDNIAVVFENQQLTYTELNARANQLAHYLQKLGVKPEVLVGICLERSLDVIIALLAILKAGGAYLPLDPALPADNISLRLEDAQATILLTQQQLYVEKLDKISLHEQGIQVFCLDFKACEDRLSLSSPTLQGAGEYITITESTENPQTNATIENLAYVIYTSGSTGKPKGVAIEHQQLLNYLDGIINRLNLPTNANFATVSTIAADLGNTSIFPALSTGGCLHIISKERASDPEALATYFNQHQIDCLKIVPSHLEALLTSAHAKSILPRQRLILGGEATSWNLIAKIQELSPECLIFNHYGPTESTVGVLTYEITSKNSEYRHSTTVPLGRPIPNTQIYILDKHLQPVPIGVKGEIYIGGASVARGYLNHPELTQDKFIIFSSTPLVKGGRGDQQVSGNKGDRLYKTGDLARYLPDGNIEFLGRVDNQVKIRGYRIELEEIEAVLSQHPDVAQAVVIQREDVAGDVRLVAYVVGKKRSLNHTDLRNFLKTKLPDYMLPSAFIFLKSLPLTSNGKVDRKALPAPDHTHNELAVNFVAPTTPLEKSLAEIWTKLLNLEQIGIHDNFFDLGGHSLLITQLVAKIRDTFQVELPIRSLFDAPTIARLAACIGTAPQKSVNAIASITTTDLNAEAILDPEIRPHTPTNQITTNPTSILLTGATGFLGAYLLDELLQQTQADIYCLVRAANFEAGKQRIQSSLETYSLWSDRTADRIIPVIGDLSQPLLGLTNEQFQTLANQIDVIYHNGAFVNFTYPYSALKAANVLGTQEVLRLACQIKVKPVHFISTMGVIFSDSEEQIYSETDTLDHGGVIPSGYTQSKWVAEKLVTIARDRGLPISIYRPGRISGHSKTGVCNPDDHTFRMIKGCIQLGMAPMRNSPVNLTPIDYASQAIIYLSQQQTSLGKAFHIINPQPSQWNDVINWISAYGYPLQQIPDQQWRTELRKFVERSPDNALYPLLSVVAENVSTESTSSSAVIQINCQNTLNGLADTSIICPPVSAKLLHTYLSFLTAQGFLNSPVECVP
ncbi:MAG: amino acid adenylation domain-containing protein [Crinalium sp.]